MPDTEQTTHKTNEQTLILSLQEATIAWELAR